LYYVEGNSRVPDKSSEDTAGSGDEDGDDGDSDTGEYYGNHSDDQTDVSLSSHSKTATASNPALTADSQSGWDDLLSKYKPPIQGDGSRGDVAVLQNNLAIPTEKEVEVVNVIYSKASDRFFVL